MFVSPSSPFQEVFSSLQSEGQRFTSIEFESCRFSACTFTNCIFEKCSFVNCTFVKCALSAVDVRNSRFADVTFLDSKVLGLDWTKATYVQELIFQRSQVNYSNFRMLKLPKITMTNCVAHEVDFTEAQLSSGNFEGTDFERSIFFKANLTKANFVGAINYSLDIKNTLLKKARFSMPEAMQLLASLDIVLEN